MPNCRQLQHVATHKPDVLFSILKQIQSDADISCIQVADDDVSSCGEEHDDIIIQADDDVTVVEETMVGPSAAELESCKELIQFDHIYHKPTTSSQGQGQMSEVKLNPEPEVIQLVTQNEVIPSPQDMPPAPILDNALTEGDNTLIDIDDLLDLSSFNWDTMNNLDFEALTETSDITTSNIAPCTKPITEAIFPKTNSVNLNITSSVPLPPHVDMVSDYPSPTRSPLNDSVYGSDLGSPLSDDTSSFDHLWEDSFTELFPSLA